MIYGNISFSSDFFEKIVKFLHKHFQDTRDTETVENFEN
jgi:hypothetical protein